MLHIWVVHFTIRDHQPLPADDPSEVTMALEDPSAYHSTAIPGKSVAQVTLDLLPITCSSFTKYSPEFEKNETYNNPKTIPSNDHTSQHTSYIQAPCVTRIKHCDGI